MPYSLRGNCVIKSDSGSVVKCHPNRKRALAHLRALKVNVEGTERAAAKMKRAVTRKR